MNRSSEPDPGSTDVGADESSAEERPGVPSEESSGRFLLLAVVVEGALAVVGIGIGLWSGIAWEPMVQPSANALLLGMLGGIGLFGLHYLLLVPGGAHNPLYRHIYRPLRRFLGSRLPDVGLGSIVLVALLSGVGEEILFRGWLQTETNIIVASILFGVAHIWGTDGIPYGLYAIGMGFVLGGLFEYTGRILWVPILAHAVNNLLGFLALKYGWFPEVPG